MRNMRKIFFLDDQMVEIANYFSEKHNVELTFARTVEDAVYYLELDEDNPIESYDYFIFDISIPGGDIDLPNGEHIEFFDKDGRNGLLVLKRYLPKIKENGAKVAVITAYPELFDLKNEEVTLISKLNSEFIRDIQIFIAN